MSQRWIGIVTRPAFAAALVATAALIASHAAPARAEDDETGRIEFHGYADVHYNNPANGTMDQSAISESDLHRAALGWEYEFTSEIRFEGEVDYEHAGKDLEVEEAFLDVDLAPTLALRSGLVLVPVGPLNEYHEPPTYYSVERPYVEQTVIPTTWQEIGFGVVGRAAGGAASYRAYVVTGLDASGFTGLQGLRDGRSGGGEAKAEDVAGAGRIEYATGAGLSLGASAYYGGAGQGEPGLDRVFVRIGSADARYRKGGLDLRALAAGVGVTGTRRILAVTGERVGRTMIGWQAEAAYDLLRRDLDPSGRRALFLFGRYERFDTNNEMARGVVGDPAADRGVATAGAAFYPIEKIAFKADYEHWKDGTDAQLNRLNLGVALQF